MEIVIEIGNEHYERIMRLEEDVTVYPTTLALYEAVKNGTPLPKGHGKLIDENELKKEAIRCECSRSMYGMLEHTLSYMKPIIEADKGEQNARI